MSSPVEVCQADGSMLDPVLGEALNSISKMMEDNPLCADYAPLDGDDELQYAQAQTDYSASLAMGAKDEFALAAVKIFKVVPCNVSDPIVIDLNGNNQFDITPLETGVNFAMTGQRQQAVSWLKGDGFLFFDANSNGIVDSGLEFIGTDTQFKSGFDHLSWFDTNKDGTFSNLDSQFSSFKVWSDANSNGICEPSEVVRLSDTRVSSIPLTSKPYARRVNGNKVKSVVRDNASKVLIGDVDLRAAMYPRL